MNDPADDLPAPPPDEGEASPRPRRRRSAARESEAPASQAVTPDVTPNVTQDVTQDARPADAAGEEGAAGGEGPAATSAEGEGQATRSRRKRRRGRKGRGAQEPGAEPQAGAPAEGAATPELPPMPDAAELFATVTAGSFDAEADDTAVAAAAGTGEAGPVPDETAEAGPERRILAPDAEAPKLQKVMAQSGLGSRRDLEQMIADGRISVNDEPAHVGQRVSWGDRVAIDGKPVKVRIAPLPTRVLAYHKPVGEVVTLDDPEGRPTVFRRLPRLLHGKWQSVGRLDINTEGLLLFTTSGELANRLMHPRFGIEREYAVRVLGQLDDEARARLLSGVPIDGQPAAFLRIEDGGGEGANHWYRVVIGEGRHREVRRLFEAVGLAVSRLIRIRYGAIVLPRGLRRGVCVDLAEDDVKMLRRMTGLGVRGEPRAPAPKKARAQGRREEPPREAAPPQPRREIPSPLAPPRARNDGKKRRGGGGGKHNLHEGFGDAALRAREHEFEAHDEAAPHTEGADFSNIPNPLQQTFDRRAIRDAQRPQREYGDDAPIPNPLQQTYDQRALKAARTPQQREHDDENAPIPNPLQQTYDKRFNKGGSGGGGGAGAPRSRAKKRGDPGGAKQGAGGQPDPMRTAVGYIGADAYLGKKGGGGGGRGRRGGPRKGR
jgi:23S rRNA pseudouridine2605 synthase